MRREDQDRIQIEVASRVVEEATRASGGDEGALQVLINDTLFCEGLRLEHASDPAGKRERAFYERINRRMQRASASELKRLVDKLARHFVAEVVGNFDPRVYKVATRALPHGLGLLLSAMSPKRLLHEGRDHHGLAERLSIGGAVEHARKLLERGTLIVVPTHSSNLDSLVMGYCAFLMGFPPFTYGAGLNLFSNPIISFFMRNLGAYRVDRRKNSLLYKQVLKEYAACSIEMGYNNLFFPGGTRSRSGAIERKLKLGLLGTGLQAYIANLKSGKDKPNVYVVPFTISYKLVLEAETLIDDHLKETGKSRYIIEDDEFSRPRRLLKFFSDIWSLDSRIVINVSTPLDVFGNRVDEQGESFDARGRPVDPRRYVMRDGAAVADVQRDAEYTRELGDEVRAAFLRDTVLMSTNVVAHAVFALLERNNPSLDLYRLLHTGGVERSFRMDEVHAEVGATLAALAARREPPRLEAVLERGDAQDIVADALKHFATYHTQAAARRRGDRVFPEDLNLLLYYANRVRSYAPLVPATAAPSAEVRS